jgi:hypothetical protein
MKGPIIKTRHLAPTNYKDARIVAFHKRDSETTWRVTLLWDHDLDGEQNGLRAARKLVETWPIDSDGEIKVCGYDHDYYYFVFCLTCHE